MPTQKTCSQSSRIEFGDCRETMRRWAAEGVKAQTCVTSPPYFGLRDYGHPGQIGLEKTPGEYVAALVEVFEGVRELLADDGVLWLNLGDSYVSHKPRSGATHSQSAGMGRQDEAFAAAQQAVDLRSLGYKNKDLLGIPWRVAFALQARGWYLRQDIIWHKPNPMPESVTDRCTKAHEYIFLLSKSERYFFDSEAMREPAIHAGRIPGGNNKVDASRRDAGRDMTIPVSETRNRRSVWTVATRPYKGAHFATFPPALIEPCILAGSRPGDLLLDPFMGSGTTAAVSIQHGRGYLGCELNPEYGPLQEERIQSANDCLPRITDLFEVAS